MKEKSETLTNAVYAVSAKMYQQTEGAAQGAESDGGHGSDAGHAHQSGDDTVVDADFEVKDDK